MHSTAGVAIRQIVVALFDKLSNQLREERGQRLRDGEEEVQELPAEATDAYLLFQVCVGGGGEGVRAACRGHWCLQGVR